MRKGRYGKRAEGALAKRSDSVGRLHLVYARRTRLPGRTAEFAAAEAHCRKPDGDLQARRLKRRWYGALGYFAGFSLRALTLNQMGEPSKPKDSRIWFSRKRSKEKCSLTSRSVKRTKVGGATAACVI